MFALIILVKEDIFVLPFLFFKFQNSFVFHVFSIDVPQANYKLFLSEWTEGFLVYEL